MNIHKQFIRKKHAQWIINVTFLGHKSHQNEKSISNTDENFLPFN